MILKNNFCFYEQGLDKDSVQEILGICDNIALEDATMGQSQETNKNYRDCLISFIDNHRIYEIITPFINKANVYNEWNFEIKCHETCQYTVYNKSQFYDYHADCTDSPYTNHLNPNFNGMMRKISMTLQLSDPESYDGGDFYVKYIQNGDVVEEKLEHAKSLGSIIVFPSFLHHKVTPVTKGTRKSLVCWTLGYPFK
jgi:PKHD-type hydroxylase